MNIIGLIQSVSAIAWMAVVGVFIFLVLRAARNTPVRRGGVFVLVAVVVAVILTTLAYGMVFINPQERGVVVSAVSAGGYRPQALDAGIHWIIPFAEGVVRYPISRQTYTMSIATNEGQVQGDDSISARTADGQEIFLDSSVIYQIDPAKVVLVHITWQNRYPEELVRAQTRGIIRDVVSQFSVQEVVSSKRFEMVKAIRDAMDQKLSDNGLMLIDFVMRNIAFSKEYAQSVEQKQIAEQQAQQAKLVVESKKQEAEQARQTAKGQADAAVTASQGLAQAKVIQAEAEAKARLLQADAEAKALDLISAALKDKPELLTYQYITKISPNVQVMFLPNNSPFVFPLPQIGPQVTPTTTPTTP